MDKKNSKINRRVVIFLGNILVGVRVVFLQDYLLVFSLLKHKDTRAFLNKKIRIPKQEKPLQL